MLNIQTHPHYSCAFQTEAKHYTEEVLLVLGKALELRIKLEAVTFKTHTYLHFHMCTCVQLQSLSLTGKAVISLHGGFSFFSVLICALLEPVKLCFG